MPKKTSLRAVGDNEKVDAKPPKTIAEAAASGDRRATLVTVRDRLARALDDPNIAARDLAATSRRFLEVCREIEAIDLADGDDEIGKAAAADDEAWDSSAI